jgi:hypothetical protein
LLLERRLAGMDLRETKAEVEAIPMAPKAPTPFSPAMGRAYGRFLELPVALVLVLLWAAGWALLGSVALVLWLAGGVLVRAVAGIP